MSICQKHCVVIVLYISADLRDCGSVEELHKLLPEANVETKSLPGDYVVIDLDEIPLEEAASDRPTKRELPLNIHSPDSLCTINEGDTEGVTRDSMNATKEDTHETI